MTNDEVIEHLLSLSSNELHALYRSLSERRQRTSPLAIKQPVKLDGQQCEKYALLTGTRRVPFSRLREHNYFSGWTFYVSDINPEEGYTIQGVSGRVVDGVDLAVGYRFHKIPRDCLIPL